MKTHILIGRLQAHLIGAVWLAAMAPPLLAAAEVAPLFELPKWSTAEKVRLADFSGSVVVLDFFAYWCGPCKRASDEVERGIQRYYASKNGNPHGVPVRVISINIEKEKPELTARYIKDLGLEFVLNDFEGLILEKYGGAGTPFLVVMDGTQSTKEHPKFRVLYKHAGFEGTKKLRQVIDKVNPSKTGRLRSFNREASAARGRRHPSAWTGTPSNTVRFVGNNTAAPQSSASEASTPQPQEPSAIEDAMEEPTGPPKTHKIEAAFEAMLSKDIDITSTALTYGQKVGGTEWSLNYTHRLFAEDYEPFRLFDFLGYPESLREDYNGLQATLRQGLGQSWTWLASAGGYQGFTDFRTLWLANYYKQNYEVFPDYEAPDPQGFSGASGFRWEYHPATGFVEGAFLYSNDSIAPGFEMDPSTGALLRGREILHTYAPTLKFENVLAPRIRVLNELQAAITSGREPRYAYRGSVNVALGERWTWRSSGGHTRENPTLRAWFAGSTLELEVHPRWLVSIFGLYYRDTGEIENSLYISTAAPGLRNQQAGLGIRYAGEKFSFHAAAAPTWSDYAPVEVGTRPFTNLYKDRAWVSITAAFSVQL